MRRLLDVLAFLVVVIKKPKIIWTARWGGRLSAYEIPCSVTSTVDISYDTQSVCPHNTAIYESCFTCGQNDSWTWTRGHPLTSYGHFAISNFWSYKALPVERVPLFVISFTNHCDGINYVRMQLSLHFKTPCRSLSVSQKGVCHASYFFETMDDSLTLQHSICRGSTALHCLFARVSEFDRSKVPKTRRRQVSSRRVIFEIF